jgi:hypothetical protein
MKLRKVLWITFNGKTDQNMRLSRMVRWLQNLYAILKGHPG